MARMFPDTLGPDQFETAGEALFYAFLRDHAKPDDDFMAWYAPGLNDRRPDFIVYYRRVGLIIFEVKDWQLDQILEANPHQFVLEQNAQRTYRSNPLVQANGYLTSLFDRLQQDGRLISDDPAHHDQPRIPIVTAVVFPNINRHQYCIRRLDTVIDPALILFQDDLSHYAPYAEDRSGRALRESLEQRFPPRFPFQLTSGDKAHLRQLLFPEVTLRPVRRHHGNAIAEQQQAIALLDQQQEILARRTLQGHQLIKGHAGSGKTLVLVHKAALLLRHQPTIQRVLFVCYNLTLVNYVERLLTGLQVPLGQPGVEVLPFFGLCERIIGDTIHHAEPDGRDYYQILVEDALDAAPTAEHYDAILLDEGQDFSDQMLRVVVAVMNPATDNLTIALDDNQNIYGQTRNWAQLRINARKSLPVLHRSYRATRQLRRFSDHLAGIAEAEDAPQLDLFPPSPAFDGPLPQLRAFSDLPALLRWLGDAVRQQLDAGHPANEIAILFLSRTLGTVTEQLPEEIRAQLRQQGVFCHWLSRNVSTKMLYDISTEAVTISTVHSVKGLDYASVFLLGLDADEDAGPWDSAALLKLAYVGITRARRHLVIPYLRETPLVERLRAGLG